uniref:Protein disulfide-isomerase A6 homolog n=1 Tax=Xenopsylla cheopis TaxID=163159 RepID=A0A6M2DVV2_XENCH
MIRLLCIVFMFGASTALYPSSGDVVELNPDNFDKLVLNSEKIWIVEFFAPWCGHCKNLVPEYSRAASALKGTVQVGAVNADEHKSLGGRYNVRGFPTIKIFGSNKNSPQDFNGQRSAQGIVESALSAVKDHVLSKLGVKSGSKDDSKDVVELTDSNFDKLVMKSDEMWLVEFYAPWCGYCKNLAPHWAKAASELKGKVKLGALDATVHSSKASQYGVQGYPTIKFFGPGKKDSDSVTDYDGGRTSSDIVNWALDKLSENIPAPEIIELINEDVASKACLKAPLCIVSVLPHILDCNADCRNKYISILQKMGDKYKKKMWGWLWTEAGAQSEIENVLEIGGFGYPAMAVVNIKKKKYSLLRGAFSEDGINDFLKDISYGRGHSASVKKEEMPKINTVDPWDGKDGVLPIEDDIDLSDIDLDEKDEL